MDFLFFSVSLYVFLFVRQAFGSLQCSRQNENQACVQECPPERTCQNKDIKFSCLNNNKGCQIKCVCKEGFFRNYNGDCVSGEACDRCPFKNEVFACGSACDTTCATLHQPCTIVNIKCNDMCYCRKGYARNDTNNVCIPATDCEPKNHENVRSVRAATYKGDSFLCDPNEDYQKCKITCPPDTCISLVAKFKCVSDPPCVAGCVCKQNYLRAEPGSPCMPIHQCPQLAHSPEFN